MTNPLRTVPPRPPSDPQRGPIPIKPVGAVVSFGPDRRHYRIGPFQTA